MVAEREHGLMMNDVIAHGGSFYATAMDDPWVFGQYFVSHIRDAGDDVYPYAYGTEGAFLFMAAGLYGWWHDPDTGTTYVSSGTDSNRAIVFGMDAGRLATIEAQAVADGVEVVRSVRMDTNEVA